MTEVHLVSGCPPIRHPGTVFRWDDEGHQDVVSKLTQSTIQERLIKPVDPASRSRKYAKYVPVA